MSKKIYSEIDIHADSKAIWRTLMEFDKFPDWNPFIQKIDGNPQKGERLYARMQLNSQKPMVFKPYVRKVVEHKHFEWLGHLLIPGLFDGRHIFRLQENGNGTTTFIQEEIFSGILLPFLHKNLEKNVPLSFDAMNQALKKQVEDKNHST
ncbi:MAG: SRPBCC domain-containing protein [Caldithrix sp.]|nr:SRPBCC domain-containing protein [Caldithrix sp.]